MIKTLPANRLRLKAVCLGLALVLGASFIAPGLMAASGCGMECCCLSKVTVRSHVPQEQMRSSMGCCSGSSQMPCDLVADARAHLPKMCLASSTGHLPTGVGPVNYISNGVIDPYGIRVNASDQGALEEFRAPPLYLQNLSFLI